MGLKTFKSGDARQGWRGVLDRVLKGEDVLIERNGKAVAVLIPVEDYEALQEELEERRAARRAALVYQAWKQDESLGRPYQQVRDELIQDGLIDE
jgi:prevent-host-death family protein